MWSRPPVSHEGDVEHEDGYVGGGHEGGGHVGDGHEGNAHDG